MFLWCMYRGGDQLFVEILPPTWYLIFLDLPLEDILQRCMLFSTTVESCCFSLDALCAPYMYSFCRMVGSHSCFWSTEQGKQYVGRTLNSSYMYQTAKKAALGRMQCDRSHRPFGRGKSGSCGGYCLSKQDGLGDNYGSGRETVGRTWCIHILSSKSMRQLVRERVKPAKGPTRIAWSIPGNRLYGPVKTRPRAGWYNTHGRKLHHPLVYRTQYSARTKRLPRASQRYFHACKLLWAINSECPRVVAVEPERSTSKHEVDHMHCNRLFCEMIWIRFIYY